MTLLTILHAATVTLNAKELDGAKKVRVSGNLSLMGLETPEAIKDLFFLYRSRKVRPWQLVCFAVMISGKF